MVSKGYILGNHIYTVLEKTNQQQWRNWLRKFCISTGVEEAHAGQGRGTEGEPGRRVEFYFNHGGHEDLWEWGLRQSSEVSHMHISMYDLGICMSQVKHSKQKGQAVHVPWERYVPSVCDKQQANLLFSRHPDIQIATDTSNQRSLGRNYKLESWGRDNI